MDLQQAFDAGFEAVKAYVERSFDAFDVRLAAMEQRVAEATSKSAPVSVTSALIDRSGSLVLTLSDGTTKDLGRVVGKDAEPGKDGFSLKDFDATLMDDGRTVLLSFDSDERSFKVELGIPAMIYRGVFKEGQSYQKGDTVTWGGSLWHCDVDETSEKPDGAEKRWTLAAKRGRDGKDGTVKAEKPAQPVRVGAPTRSPEMALLVSLAFVKRALRIAEYDAENDVLEHEDDDVITSYIESAQDAVLRYLRIGVDDLVWDEDTIPPAVRASILMAVKALYDPQQADLLTGLGSSDPKNPIVAMLCMMRKPTVA